MYGWLSQTLFYSIVYIYVSSNFCAVDKQISKSTHINYTDSVFCLFSYIVRFVLMLGVSAL